MSLYIPETITSDTCIKDIGEEKVEDSKFASISNLKKRNEPEDNGGNENKLDGGKNVYSNYTFGKPVDDVTKMLESNIPVRMVLPPTREENSRCKGK